MSTHDGLRRSDDEWFELVERSPSLSPKSKISYKKQLRAAIKAFKVEGDNALTQILQHPDIYGDMRSVADNSLRTYLGAIVSLFKRGEEGEFFHRSDPAIARLQSAWSELLQKSSKRYLDTIDTNQRSDREEESRATMQDWQRVFEKSLRDDMESPETLLLGFHAVVHPPLRGGDLARVHIGYLPEGNCIFRNPEDPRSIVLLIRDHKTSKSFGPLKRVLTNEIVPLLRHNFKHHPREWLFMTQGGVPFSDSGFSSWKSSVFHEAFGRPVTTNSLRHEYISGMDRQNQSLADARQVARDMGHGLYTQRQYVRFDRG
jgi:hypothetical protein